jgi:succinoglycan biosynthesis transport protein ExoP
MNEPRHYEPGADSEAYSPEHEVRLFDYWRILVHRRLLVLGCLALVVVATMSLTFLTAPTYRATTTLEIQRYAPEVVEFTDVVGVDPSSYWDFHRTQQKILESRVVARIAADRLDLLHRPEFAGRRSAPIGRFIGWTRSLLTSAGTEPLPPDIDNAIAYIQRGLSVSLVRNSYLVLVSFEDRDATLAADAANAVASAYQQFQHDRRYVTTGEAKEFLTKDVVRVRQEIAELEKEHQDYGVEKEILALSDGTQDISEQALADINRRYIEKKSQLAAAEARYLTVRGAPPEALPEVLKSPIIGNLRQRHAELERQHAQMAERFKPDWPALVQLAEELDTASVQLYRESENIALHVRAAAQADYEAAKAEFRAVATHRETQKLEVQRVSRDAIDYASLKTQIDAKREVLGGLMTRESETDTTQRLGAMKTSNVRVVDSAEVPDWPVKPNKRLNFLLSILFGLGLGAGMALLVDHLDNTIKSEGDIQRNSKLTVLGHVPLTRSLEVVGDDPGRASTYRLDLASHLDPRSHFSETFRSLRTSLLLATPDRPPRHVLVTSCEPGDGKSTVTLNLAIVLTQMGRKVLVVDADLRRPRIHKALALSSDQGLSNYLSGNAAIDQLVHETEIPNLHVISSGPIPPNPSELLGSPKLDVLLGDFLTRNGYDHLILDSPPLLSVTDAIVLSTRTDSTIVVVRSGSTRKEALAQSASRLGQSRANVIGTVLNAVPGDAGYYYRYRWYRGYNDGVGESSSEPRTSIGKRDRRRRAG